MGKLARTLGGLAICVLVSACGSEGGPGSLDQQPEEPRGPVPPPPGEGVLEVALAEGEVPPGEETIHCEYLAPLESDTYMARLETYQSEGGHHLVLYQWLGEEKPAGTVEDCADAAQMAQMILVATPIVAPEAGPAYVEFPEGSALRIAAGTQIVAQYHYINASPEPLHFRDVAHLQTVPVQTVERVIRVFALGSVDFAVPAQGAVTDAFECDIPFDMELLLTFPHMHEYGTKFFADVGGEGAFRTIIDVAEWDPRMRDVPPITGYLDQSVPPPFSKGEQVRTFCTWENPTAKEIRFPSEMCATVGYFSSDDPAADNVLCPGTNKIAPIP